MVFHETPGHLQSLSRYMASLLKKDLWATVSEIVAGVNLMYGLRAQNTDIPKWLRELASDGVHTLLSRIRKGSVLNEFQLHVKTAKVGV